MNYFGSGMLAMLFLLQACDHDKPAGPSDHKSETKPQTKPQTKPADGLAVKKKDIKDVRTTLSREDSVRFYMALLTASSGQEGIEGDCGNLGKHFTKKVDNKSINVKIPYKACKVDNFLIHGDVQITGKRDKQERANAIGQLTVEGAITGFCNINLNYPTKSLFKILDNVNAENADLQAIEADELKGKFCDLDVEDLVKDVEKALATQAQGDQVADDQANVDQTQVVKPGKVAKKVAAS